jgi:hypothetical protein
MKEMKRNRFVRVAERRVNNLLRDFDSLGKCANRKNYDYSSDDVKRIFQAIEKKLKVIKSLYESSSEDKRTFTLKTD